MPEAIVPSKGSERAFYSTAWFGYGVHDTLHKSMKNLNYLEKISDFNMAIISLYVYKISTWKDNRCHIDIDTLVVVKKTNNNVLTLF